MSRTLHRSHHENGETLPRMPRWQRRSAERHAKAQNALDMNEYFWTGKWRGA